MAEWLRRLTRNQFPSGSVGSNPTVCVFDRNEERQAVFHFYVFNLISKSLLTSAGIYLDSQSDEVEAEK